MSYESKENHHTHEEAWYWANKDLSSYDLEEGAQDCNQKEEHFQFSFLSWNVFSNQRLRFVPRCVSAKHMAESLSRQVRW